VDLLEGEGKGGIGCWLPPDPIFLEGKLRTSEGQGDQRAPGPTVVSYSRPLKEKRVVAWLLVTLCPINLIPCASAVLTEINLISVSF
jgi:hypothetical protein